MGRPYSDEVAFAPGEAGPVPKASRGSGNPDRWSFLELSRYSEDRQAGEEPEDAE